MERVRVRAEMQAKRNHRQNCAENQRDRRATAGQAAVANRNVLQLPSDGNDDNWTSWGEPLFDDWQDRPPSAQLRDFDRNPDVALYAFWALSGKGRDNPHEPRDSLRERIGVPMTAERSYELLCDATARTDPYQRIVGCASCGERAVGVEGDQYVRQRVRHSLVGD